MLTSNPAQNRGLWPHLQRRMRMASPNDPEKNVKMLIKVDRELCQTGAPDAGSGLLSECLRDRVLLVGSDLCKRLLEVGKAVVADEVDAPVLLLRIEQVHRVADLLRADRVVQRK